VANERRILLRTEGLESLPPIRADERRLFNIFYNLLNNAIPEVPSGGSVTVKGRVEPESKILVFSVADTGRGMSSEVRESLFTNRVISRKHGGTGLGTRIVKDVVDAHGGWIKVESEEGKGTTFVFSLPFEPPPSQDSIHA
jgi:signal transduction histidine kinase